MVLLSRLQQYYKTKCTLDLLILMFIVWMHLQAQKFGALKLIIARKVGVRHYANLPRQADQWYEKYVDYLSKLRKNLNYLLNFLK